MRRKKTDMKLMFPDPEKTKLVPIEGQSLEIAAGLPPMRFAPENVETEKMPVAGPQRRKGAPRIYVQPTERDAMMADLAAQRASCG